MSAKLNIERRNFTWKNELTAGLIGFFTTVYIIAVNGTILSQAGISIENGMLATILVSFVGTLIMGLFGNLPLIVIPGMGINALFAYTIIGENGFTFQEGLAVVLVASIIFLITAFSRLGMILKNAIPDSLKHAITVGLGFFLIFIGLENSQLIITGEHTIIAIGDFTSPIVIVSLLSLVLAVFLFIKNIPANFLITMLGGTLIAFLFGTLDTGNTAVSFQNADVVFMPAFSAVNQLSFWLAAFPLAMILIFENMGILHGQLDMLKETNRYEKAYKVTAFSAVTSAFLGSSPTVAAAENPVMIASKGKTGRAAIFASGLFLLSIFMIPFISYIPMTAISPILIIVGILMAQNLRHIPLDDVTEAIPALLVAVMIPFTYSIADGMAFGFIMYPIVKIAMGKSRELSTPLMIISGLFLIDFLIKIIGI